MKFLIFNVAFAAAIVYLVFNDGDTMTAAVEPGGTPSLSQAAVSTAGELGDFLSGELDKISSARKQLEADPVTPPQLEARQVPVRTVHRAPGQLSGAQVPQTNPSTPKAEPVVAKSSGDRRKELNKLAQDMELMFADRLAR